MERGANRVCGGVGRARDRAVGLAFAHEEVAVVERVSDGDARLVGHEALRAPQLVVERGDALEVGRAAVVEYRDAAKVSARVARGGANLLLVAEHRDAREPFARDD